MSKHTPEPWISTKAGPVMEGYSQGDAIVSLDNNTLIAGCFSDVRGGPEVAEANARRIVACVNWCSGIGTGALEKSKTLGEVVELYDRKFEQQRDELLAALKLVMPMAKGYALQNPVGNNFQFICDAESVVAKIEAK